jgi:hypothetical protein
MPPVAVVVKVHRTVGLSEDQGTGDQQRWIRVGVIGGVRVCSASVMCPVDFTNLRNSATVTGCWSIQDPSTDT